VQPPRLVGHDAPTARGGRRSLFTFTVSSSRKFAFDPAICTSFPAMRSVLGVAESTVLKVHDQRAHPPQCHHRTDRDDGQKCGSLRHRKGAGAAVAGYTLTSNTH